MQVWLMMEGADKAQCAAAQQYAERMWADVQERTKKKFGSAQSLPFAARGMCSTAVTELGGADNTAGMGESSQIFCLSCT